jgi:DNA-binding transcriptional LysR family regulator
VHIPWDDVQLFLAVAEAGSLSAASRRLQVTQPTVSRRLAELEARLGEPLFARNVEGVALTSFGERLVVPAQRMAEWAGEAERVAQRAETAPRGVVRITAPPGVAFDLLAPFAAWLRSELPDVRLEIVSTVEYLDLARREADLALRFQRPPSRDLVALATVPHRVAAFAAKSYVERLPRGYSMSDVGFIGWAPPLDHLSPNPELARAIPGFSPVFASDDFLVQLRAAEAGVGAILLGAMRHRFSTPSSLEALALDFGRIPAALYLVCAKSALDVPRVRAVADLLVHELEAIDTTPPEPSKKKDTGSRGRTTKAVKPKR